MRAQNIKVTARICDWWKISSFFSLYIIFAIYYLIEL